MSDWRPIKTAPKEPGNHLLVATRRYVDMAFWADGYGLMPRAGWYRATTGEGIRPTHWMPLPSPPGAQYAKPEAGKQR